MTNVIHTITKRKRGRPTGASKYATSDRAILEKVADRLVREPGLIRTDLIRYFRVIRVGVSEESEIHRLNKNWRTSKKELLADAKRRSDAQTSLGWKRYFKRNLEYIPSE